jgi:hypothetical protein
MHKLLIPIALTVLLSACSPTPTMSSTATSPGAALSPESDTPAANAQPIPTSTVTIEAAGSIALQVISPLDEAVVNTPQVDVIGTAPAGTVVSVNEEIILVDDDGRFTVIVTLEEGPNLIEILASDVNGNESSLLVSITYEP